MAQMDKETKQLYDSGRQLQKAFDGGDPPSTILSLLAPLEKTTPTEDQLRSSKIGVAVAKLRGSKNAEVASAASRLVNQWKAAVKKKPGAGHQAGVSPAGGKPAVNGAAVNGRSGTSSPAPKKEAVAAAPKKYSVPPEKRNAKEDGVDTAVTGNATRDGCLQLIYNGLSFMSEEAPAEILAVARDVEQAAFNAYKPETSATYKGKMRSLHLNLKMKTSTALRRDVFNRTITPEKFVNMTSEELKSEDRKQSDAKLQKENMNNAMTAQEEKAISTTMTCGKCKQSRVAYSQAQTRSADEPMTTFCECTVCGNRWKFS